MEMDLDQEGAALPMARFADGIPENCPPAHAIAASGEVFRVVRNNPPMAEDFLTWAEEGKFDEDRV